MERVCSFSFQVVTTKTNQTRGYCPRKLKVDQSENTSSKKKCFDPSLHHDNFIVKNAIETSVETGSFFTSNKLKKAKEGIGSFLQT